jgi:putative DNA primase/helicase
MTAAPRQPTRPLAGAPVVDLARRDDPLPGEPLTDIGYARRLVAVHRDQVRYVPEWRRWLTWDGQRWADDTAGQVSHLAAVIARRVTESALDELRKADGEDDRKAAKRKLALALAHERENAVRGAVAIAAATPRLVVTVDRLDADPHLLNVANGTLDLRTMTLRGHDPRDLITRAAVAAYRPEARSDRWEAFLETVQPDKVMRAYLARLIGLALEGRVTEHLLQVHYGNGSNGKTTFFEAVAWALGDYAAHADPELVVARRFEAHPTGVAALYGLRLALLPETDAGQALAEGTVKRLTGGDQITARRMREDFWSFRPSHTFAMMTNHRPQVSGTDRGIWRRLKLVPWDVEIPPAEQDPELYDELRGDADAILAWALAGYLDWAETGTGDPDEVTEATEAWRVESDALGRFIAQRCRVQPGRMIGSSKLFAVWMGWCEAENEPPGTLTAFASLMKRQGFGNHRTARGMVWDGLDLLPDQPAQPASWAGV